MTVRPRWTRVVGAVWVAAGVAAVLSGIVVVIDQHDAARWEFVVGAGFLVVGVLLGRQELRVDQHGVEQHVGWRRSRLLWSTIDRVAVGQEGVRGGPVRVWHTGVDQPDVLAATWGTSRHQRADLAAAITSLTEAFDIEVSSDVEPAAVAEAPDQH